MTGTFKELLDKNLSYISVASITVAGITAFIDEIGKLTNLSLSIVAFFISVSWCYYIFIAKNPPVLVESQSYPKYGKKMKTAGVFMSVVALIFVGNASYKIYKSKIPDTIKIVIVNHTGGSIDYLERKADFFIKKPGSPLTDDVIDSGILELSEPEENTLSGPWIKIKGSTNKLVAKIRNKKRFQQYYDNGEFDADVVFKIGTKLYRETVKFSQDGIGILIYTRWVR